MQYSKRLRAYVETALWSSTGDNDQPLDCDYDIDDLAPATVEKLKRDVDKFFTVLERAMDGDRTLLESALEYAGSSGGDNDAEGTICHDLWLTQNGHGAGFWDGDYGEYGDRLTQIAKAFGECTLYVGDDGLIYYISCGALPMI